MPDRNPTLPLYQSLRLRKNCCILLMPFLHCHAHLWRKEGGSLGGGEGGWIGSAKWWWMMMRWISFYILYTMAFWGLEDDIVLIFCFYFLTLLAPCMLYFENGLVLKLCAKTLRLLKGNWRPEKWSWKWIMKNNKKSKMKIIREILRERTIKQLQFIRG